MPSLAHQNRWWWLLRSYFANKAFLVALAMAAFFTVLMYLAILERPNVVKPNYPSSPRGRVVVNTQDSLEAIRREGRQAEVDELNLAALWLSQSRRNNQRVMDVKSVDPPESFYDLLTEFPNVRILQVELRDDHTGVEKIARQTQLAYLRIYSSNFRDLSRLRTLVALERLDLMIMRPVKKIESLSALPRLQMIVFEYGASLSPESCGELAALPQLRTLVLPFLSIPGPQGQAILNSLPQLASAPKLETLYIGRTPDAGSVDVVQQTRELLPRLNVYPAMVPQQMPLAALLVPTIIIGVTAGAMLASQLRHSGSWVIPRFVARNATVAGAWVAVISLLQIPLLIIAGFAWASVPLTLAVTTFSLCGCLGGLALQPPAHMPKRHQYFLVALGLSLAAVLFIPASVLELREGNPWLLLGLILLSAVSLAIGRLCLSPLARADSPPALAQWPKLGQVRYQPSWSFATEERERTIESWPRSADYWNAWRRIQRWRAGNPPLRSLRFGIWASLWAVLSAGFSALLSQKIETFRSQMVLMPVIMMGILSLVIAQAWFTRTGSLGAESLRPTLRKDFQREWALALVLDLVSGLAVLAALQAITANLAVKAYGNSLLASWTVNWAHVPFDFLLVVLGTVPMFVAVTGLLILIRRPWVKILVISVTLLATSLATGLLIGLSVANPSALQADPRLVLFKFWLPAVIGASISYVLYRKWRSMELEGNT